MDKRRTYYRNNVRNARFPYVLILVIIALLYVMNNIHKDNNELSINNDILQYELLEKDSIINSLNKRKIIIITEKPVKVMKSYKRLNKIIKDDKPEIKETVLDTNVVL